MIEPRSEVTCIDYIEFMKSLPDKSVGLALLDPEYGINAGAKKSYHPNALTQYAPKKWDSKIPDAEYFEQVFRVSVNQIIWGGNYFTEFLPPQPKWIVWDKMQPEGIDQAMFELAWQSNPKKQAKIYRQSAQSNCNKVANNKAAAQQYIRIHATQKPVDMYKWCLYNYANEGDLIMDCGVGSQSSRIAAYDMGFDFIGCDNDPDMIEKGNKRFENFKAQLKMF